jgi:hypothetical protein
MIAQKLREGEGEEGHKWTGEIAGAPNTDLSP